jgi:hypothetical protein
VRPRPTAGLHCPRHRLARPLKSILGNVVSCASVEGREALPMVHHVSGVAAGRSRRRGDARGACAPAVYNVLCWPPGEPGAGCECAWRGEFVASGDEVTTCCNLPEDVHQRERLRCDDWPCHRT